MVVVEFDYNEFKEFFDEKKEKTIEILNRIGAPAEVDGETGKVFAEITPNRPDWYSVIGLARAVSAYKTGKTKKYEVEKTNMQIIVDKKVSKIRPYTAGAVVKGVRLTDRDVKDIVLLQEKLIATLGRWVKKFGLGVYPAEKITFPLYYTTLPPERIIYKPLNYPKEANAEEILREHPKGQAYGNIIKGSKEYPVYLDANKKIMALIPIVNSEETGKIDAGTHDIFVEVSGVDLNSINHALNILVCHLADLGGRICALDVVYANKKIATPNLAYREVKIMPSRIKKILGIEVKENEIKECLARMGYLVEKNKIYAPPYRADIIGEIDVIEDMAIAYGYENFEPTIPNFFSIGKKERRKEEIDNIMQRMGFVEVVTPILTNDEMLNEFGFEGIKVLNPKTKEYTTVRSSMLPSMMEVIIKNKMGGLPQKFYEVGRVVESNGEEKDFLCFSVVDKCDFSVVRGYLQVLFREIGKEFSLESVKNPFFENGYGMNIIVNNQVVGFGGKISQHMSQKNKLETPVFIFQVEIV